MKHSLKEAVRRILAVMIIGTLVMTAFKQVSAKELSLYATSAVLMDGESGRILYGKEENVPLPNASTTKIMTCILILENCEMNETVTISSYCESMPKVHLGAVCGETYDVKSLLYSLMLESHNDSAVALAEHLGKRILPELAEKAEKNFTAQESLMAVKAFSGLMNRKAAEIGCDDVYFITPNGLDASEEIRMDDGTIQTREHHVTAKDLAKILAYCIRLSPKRQSFLELTETPQYSFAANGRYFVLQNHNAFLNMMDGALTGKTGFTAKAGYCYVGALQRDDRLYVVALLACGWPNNRTYKWKDCRKLMEYGLSNYQRRELPRVKEEGLPKVRVLKGQTDTFDQEAWTGVTILERQGQSQKGSFENYEGILLRGEEELEVTIEMPSEVSAPVGRGQKLGEIQYWLGDGLLKTETIVAGQDVLKIDLEWCFQRIMQKYFRLGE